MTTMSEAIDVVDELMACFHPNHMNERRAELLARRISTDLPETRFVRTAAVRLERSARFWPSYAELFEAYREEAGLANGRNNMSPRDPSDVPSGPVVPVTEARPFLDRFRQRFGQRMLDTVQSR